MALRYLYGTVTQGSADAYAQADITTGLEGVLNRAIRIRELLVQWPLAMIGNVNAQNVELSLTRTSQAAMPTLASLGLFWRDQRRVAFTTSGAIWGSVVDRIKYDEADELLVVEPTIYFQIDSASTSASNSASVRIGYELVSIGELERLNLRLESLAAE